jgi:hypothetical protein
MSTPARADTIVGYYGDEQVVERSSEYEIALRPGWAKVRIRREIYNGGNVVDEAILTIEHPRESVAIGLRTKSGVFGAPWWTGRLLDAQIAEERYRKLTGRGEAIPRDPALLYWVSPETLGLQVFPCAVKKSQWIEYTLLFPTSFENGKIRFDTSNLGVVDSDAKVLIAPEDPRDWVILNGVEYRPGAAATLIAKHLDTLELGQRRSPLRTRFASIGLKSGRSIDRIMLETAQKISEIPRNAYVVVLLDNSFSMEKDDELLGLYRPLVGAYLSNFVEAKTAIALFDRNVTEVTHGFESVASAINGLANWSKQLRNGSDLDRALTRVHQLFDSAPRGAPRRLLIVSDSLTRSTLDGAKVAQLMRKTGALVHLSSIDRGSPALDETRVHVFQDAVFATGGLTWTATIPAVSEVERLTGASDVFEEWARPRYYRIERLRVGGRDVVVPEEELRLGEGQQWADESLRAGGSRPLDVQARLWSMPVRRRLPSDRSEEILGAAFVTSHSGDYEDLAEAEFKELAYRGGAVTPLTSYLAVEPGVRPSTAGIEREELGEGVGLGSIGHGSGVGSGMAGESIGPFDPDAWWRKQLLEIRRACRGDALSVRLSLETTRDEIVEVLILETTPKAPLVQACISEALWNTQIPYAFSRWERENWQLTVP